MSQYITGAAKREAIDRYLNEAEESSTFADGLDEAIIGLARQHTRPPVVVYALERVIDIYAREMSREEAEEYVEFNVTGAWVGETTPLFLTRPWEDEMEPWEHEL